MARNYTLVSTKMRNSVLMSTGRPDKPGFRRMGAEQHSHSGLEISTHCVRDRRKPCNCGLSVIGLSFCVAKKKGKVSKIPAARYTADKTPSLAESDIK